MEICFHPGLPKSGTTTIQVSLAESLGTPGKAWFPILEGLHPTNHAPLIWPLLDHWQSGAHREFIDWMAASCPDTLASIVSRAESMGVETLIISSEALDALTDSAALRLREQCGDHRVRAVFTVTPPLHRWASLWQESVKQGASATPARSAWLKGCLEPGRLEQVVSRFPADTKVVRLVSRDTADPDLAASVARACGVEVSSGAEPVCMNESIGADAALLAHLNAIGATTGMLTHASVRTFNEARRGLAGRRLDPFAAEDFVIPEEVARCADTERAYFERVTDDGTVTVIDPADAIATWGVAGLPEWYRKLMEESAGEGDPWRGSPLADQHESMRERFFVAQVRLEATELERARLESELSSARQEVARISARSQRLKHQIDAIHASRTWRASGLVAWLLRRRGRPPALGRASSATNMN